MKRTRVYRNPRGELYVAYSPVRATIWWTRDYGVPYPGPLTDWQPVPELDAEARVRRCGRYEAED